MAESTGTSFTFKTGEMVYKPLAVRAALIAGFRRALPVFRYMIVVAVAAVMRESPQGFPRGVGRAESPAFWLSMLPLPDISTACFLAKTDFRLFGSPDRRNSDSCREDGVF